MHTLGDAHVYLNHFDALGEQVGPLDSVQCSLCFNYSHFAFSADKRTKTFPNFAHQEESYRHK